MQTNRQFLQEIIDMEDDAIADSGNVLYSLEDEQLKQEMSLIHEQLCALNNADPDRECLTNEQQDEADDLFEQMLNIIRRQLATWNC